MDRVRVREHSAAVAGVIGAAILALLLRSGPAGAVAIFSCVCVLAAWRFGAMPAIVALFAAILTTDVFFTTTPRVQVGPWTAIAVGWAVSIWVVSRLRRRREEASLALGSAERDLRAFERAGRLHTLLEAAHERLEWNTDELAAIVLNGYGLISIWTEAAGRMYRAPAIEMLGVGAERLFDDVGATGIQMILEEATRTGTSRWTGVHRRRDGTTLEVELEVQPIAGVDAYTLVVRDLAERRAHEAFRQAATLSETALREDVELMRRQLGALESVTDPTLDPAREADVEELLETLRVSVDADGVAFLAGGIRRRLISARGLVPSVPGSRPQLDARHSVNRVLLIQNDPARVAQSSTLVWPQTVSCLVAVPIEGAGQRRGVLEVVNERPRPATDADMALIRVVANRVASFGAGYGETGAVA